MKQTQPVKEIHPAVVPAQYFIFAPLISGFAALFPGFFTFVISNIIVRSSEPVIQSGLIVFLLAFCAVMFLVYLKVFKEPGRTLYRIYPEKLEYEEGLLNRQKRTVVFDQVIDVHLTEGILQQTKAVGSIRLITQQMVSTGEGRLTNRTVSLRNVPNPQEVYQLLQELALNQPPSTAA